MAPTPDVLVKPIVNRLKGFSVTYNGQAVGKNGVNALFIYFWNDGQLPILQSDVIDSYSFGFPKNTRILDLAILKTTRAILGIEAAVVSDKECDLVELKFAVLEPGDGLQIQVIIDGPSDSQITFAGSCIGSAKVRVLAPNSNYFVTRIKRFEDVYIPVVVSTIPISAIYGIIAALDWVATKLSLERWVGIGVALVFGSVMLWAVSYILYKKWTAASVPPQIRSS